MEAVSVFFFFVAHLDPKNAQLVIFGSQPEVLPEAERLGLNAQERWDGKAVPRCA